ncbi:MAG TPA: HAD family hydrolase [Candidatus Eisenbacteria bacterium]|nr:HAD family hydrolase [Candidatus Eisenbacteria bacterium]
MGIAAFFDIDGTLLARNSAPLYMRHLRRTGQARRRDVAWTLYYLARYKLGLLDIQSTLGESMRFVVGKDERTMREDCERWYVRDVRQYLYPQMAALVAAHREAGHVPVLATSATRYLAEPLAADLGIGHFLVTQLEVEEGLFTGKVVHPICYAEGKVHWARALATREGLDLAESYFYTDSVTDLPLLEAVGHPLIVHPDPPLRRVAQRRGWPILRPRLGERTPLPLAIAGPERYTPGLT